MSKSFDFGREAESFAVNYFLNQGFKILATNYFFQKAEIDLILEKDQLLIVVEIKARSYNPLVKPELAVNIKKKKLLLKAINQFIYVNNIDADVRFDILALEKKGSEWLINHFVDAFNALEL